MLKLIVPLLILLFVALIGVNTYENYVSYTGTMVDASGNMVDASGNMVDASGNVLGIRSSTGATIPGAVKNGLITLSLTDLLALFRRSSVSPATATATGAATGAGTGATGTGTGTGATGAGTATTTNNVIDMYNQIKPSLISDISNAVRSGIISGSPYTPARPMSGGGICSDSSAQGAELQHAQSTMIDSNEYIRKDSIPCYGCSLPQ